MIAPYLDHWYAVQGVDKKAGAARAALNELAHCVGKAGSGISFAAGVVKLRMPSDGVPGFLTSDPQAAAEER